MSSPNIPATGTGLERLAFLAAYHLTESTSLAVDSVIIPEALRFLLEGGTALRDASVGVSQIAWQEAPVSISLAVMAAYYRVILQGGTACRARVERHFQCVPDSLIGRAIGYSVGAGSALCYFAGIEMMKDRLDATAWQFTLAPSALSLAFLIGREKPQNAGRTAPL